MIIQGKIEAKELKTAKSMQQYAVFTIEKKKFNTFDAEIISNFVVGDMVTIEIVKDGIYDKMISMKKVEPQPSNEQNQTLKSAPVIEPLFLQEIVIQLKRIADALEKKNGN